MKKMVEFLHRHDVVESLRPFLAREGLFGRHENWRSSPVRLDALRSLARRWRLHNSASNFWKRHRTHIGLSTSLKAHVDAWVDAHDDGTMDRRWEHWYETGLSDHDVFAILPEVSFYVPGVAPPLPILEDDMPPSVLAAGLDVEEESPGAELLADLASATRAAEDAQRRSALGASVEEDASAGQGSRRPHSRGAGLARPPRTSSAAAPASAGGEDDDDVDEQAVAALRSGLRPYTGDKFGQRGQYTNSLLYLSRQPTEEGPKGHRVVSRAVDRPDLDLTAGAVRFAASPTAKKNLKLSRFLSVFHGSAAEQDGEEAPAVPPLLPGRARSPRAAGASPRSGSAPPRRRRVRGALTPDDDDADAVEEALMASVQEASARRVAERKAARAAAEAAARRPARLPVQPASPANRHARRGSRLLVPDAYSDSGSDGEVASPPDNILDDRVSNASSDSAIDYDDYEPGHLRVGVEVHSPPLSPGVMRSSPAGLGDSAAGQFPFDITPRGSAPTHSRTMSAAGPMPTSPSRGGKVLGLGGPGGTVIAAGGSPRRAMAARVQSDRAAAAARARARAAKAAAHKGERAFLGSLPDTPQAGGGFFSPGMDGAGPPRGALQSTEELPPPPRKQYISEANAAPAEGSLQKSLQQQAARALKHLSRSPEFRRHIIREGAYRALVQVLVDSVSPATRQDCATALCNLSAVQGIVGVPPSLSTAAPRYSAAAAQGIAAYMQAVLESGRCAPASLELNLMDSMPDAPTGAAQQEVREKALAMVASMSSKNLLSLAQDEAAREEAAGSAAAADPTPGDDHTPLDFGVVVFISDLARVATGVMRCILATTLYNLSADSRNRHTLAIELAVDALLALMQPAAATAASTERTRRMAAQDAFTATMCVKALVNVACHQTGRVALLEAGAIASFIRWWPWLGARLQGLLAAGVIEPMCRKHQHLLRVAADDGVVLLRDTVAQVYARWGPTIRYDPRTGEPRPLKPSAYFAWPAPDSEGAQPGTAPTAVLFEAWVLRRCLRALSRLTHSRKGIARVLRSFGASAVSEAVHLLVASPLGDVLEAAIVEESGPLPVTMPPAPKATASLPHVGSRSRLGVTRPGTAASAAVEESIEKEGGVDGEYTPAAQAAWYRASLSGQLLTTLGVGRLLRKAAVGLCRMLWHSESHLASNHGAGGAIAAILDRCNRFAEAETIDGGEAGGDARTVYMCLAGLCNLLSTEPGAMLGESQGALAALARILDDVKLPKVSPEELNVYLTAQAESAVVAGRHSDAGLPPGPPRVQTGAVSTQAAPSTGAEEAPPPSSDPRDLAMPAVLAAMAVYNASCHSDVCRRLIDGYAMPSPPLPHRPVTDGNQSPLDVLTPEQRALHLGSLASSRRTSAPANPEAVAPAVHALMHLTALALDSLKAAGVNVTVFTNRSPTSALAAELERRANASAASAAFALTSPTRGRGQLEAASGGKPPIAPTPSSSFRGTPMADGAPRAPGRLGSFSESKRSFRRLGSSKGSISWTGADSQDDTEEAAPIIAVDLPPPPAGGPYFPRLTAEQQLPLLRVLQRAMNVSSGALSDGSPVPPVFPNTARVLSYCLAALRNLSDLDGGHDTSYQARLLKAGVVPLVMRVLTSRQSSPFPGMSTRTIQQEAKATRPGHRMGPTEASRVIRTKLLPAIRLVIAQNKGHKHVSKPSTVDALLPLACVSDAVHVVSNLSADISCREALVKANVLSLLVPVASEGPFSAMSLSLALSVRHIVKRHTELTTLSKEVARIKATIAQQAKADTLPTVATAPSAAAEPAEKGKPSRSPSTAQRRQAPRPAASLTSLTQVPEEEVDQRLLAEELAMKDTASKARALSALALCNLSTDVQFMDSANLEGALQALKALAAVGAQDDLIRLRVAAALRTLSCAGVHVLQMMVAEAVVPVVVAMASSNKEEVRKECVGTLYNLSALKGTELHLTGHGAVEALSILALIRNNEPAVVALCVEALHNILASPAARMKALERGIPWTLKRLCLSPATAVQRACAMTLFKLVAHSETQDMLVEQGAVHSVIKVLTQSAMGGGPEAEATESVHRANKETFALERDLVRAEGEGRAPEPPVIAQQLPPAAVPATGDPVVGSLFAGILATVSKQRGHEGKLVAEGAVEALVLLSGSQMREADEPMATPKRAPSSITPGARLAPSAVSPDLSIAARGAAEDLMSGFGAAALRASCALGLYNFTNSPHEQVLGRIVQGGGAGVLVHLGSDGLERLRTRRLAALGMANLLWGLPLSGKVSVVKSGAAQVYVSLLGQRLGQRVLSPSLRSPGDTAGGSLMAEEGEFEPLPSSPVGESKSQGPASTVSTPTQRRPAPLELSTESLPPAVPLIDVHDWYVAASTLHYISCVLRPARRMPYFTPTHPRPAPGTAEADALAELLAGSGPDVAHQSVSSAQLPTWAPSHEAGLTPRDAALHKELISFLLRDGALSSCLATLHRFAAGFSAHLLRRSGLEAMLPEELHHVEFGVPGQLEAHPLMETAMLGAGTLANLAASRRTLKALAASAGAGVSDIATAVVVACALLTQDSWDAEEAGIEVGAAQATAPAPTTPRVEEEAAEEWKDSDEEDTGDAGSAREESTGLSLAPGGEAALAELTQSPRNATLSISVAEEEAEAEAAAGKPDAPAGALSPRKVQTAEELSRAALTPAPVPEPITLSGAEARREVLRVLVDECLVVLGIMSTHTGLLKVLLRGSALGAATTALLCPHLSTKTHARAAVLLRNVTSMPDSRSLMLRSFMHSAGSDRAGEEAHGVGSEDLDLHADGSPDVLPPTLGGTRRTWQAADFLPSEVPPSAALECLVATTVDAGRVTKAHRATIARMEAEADAAADAAEAQALAEAERRKKAARALSTAPQADSVAETSPPDLYEDLPPVPVEYEPVDPSLFAFTHLLKPDGPLAEALTMHLPQDAEETGTQGPEPGSAGHLLLRRTRPPGSPAKAAAASDAGAGSEPGFSATAGIRPMRIPAVPGQVHHMSQVSYGDDWDATGSVYVQGPTPLGAHGSLALYQSAASLPSRASGSNFFGELLVGDGSASTLQVEVAPASQTYPHLDFLVRADCAKALCNLAGDPAYHAALIETGVAVGLISVADSPVCPKPLRHACLRALCELAIDEEIEHAEDDSEDEGAPRAPKRAVEMSEAAKARANAALEAATSAATRLPASILAVAAHKQTVVSAGAVSALIAMMKQNGMATNPDVQSRNGITPAFGIESDLDALMFHVNTRVGSRPDPRLYRGYFLGGPPPGEVFAPSRPRRSSATSETPALSGLDAALQEGEDANLGDPQEGSAAAETGVRPTPPPALVKALLGLDGASEPLATPDSTGQAHSTTWGGLSTKHATGGAFWGGVGGTGAAVEGEAGSSVAAVDGASAAPAWNKVSRTLEGVLPNSPRAAYGHGLTSSSVSSLRRSTFTDNVTAQEFWQDATAALHHKAGESNQAVVKAPGMPTKIVIRRRGSTHLIDHADGTDLISQMTAARGSAGGKSSLASVVLGEAEASLRMYDLCDSDSASDGEGESATLSSLRQKSVEASHAAQRVGRRHTRGMGKHDPEAGRASPAVGSPVPSSARAAATEAGRVRDEVDEAFPFVCPPLVWKAIVSHHYTEDPLESFAAAVPNMAPLLVTSDAWPTTVAPLPQRAHSGASRRELSYGRGHPPADDQRALSPALLAQGGGGLGKLSPSAAAAAIKHYVPVELQAASALDLCNALGTHTDVAFRVIQADWTALVPTWARGMLPTAPPSRDTSGTGVSPAAVQGLGGMQPLPVQVKAAETRLATLPPAMAQRPALTAATLTHFLALSMWAGEPWASTLPDPDFSLAKRAAYTTLASPLVFQEVFAVGDARPAREVPLAPAAISWEGSGGGLLTLSSSKRSLGAIPESAGPTSPTSPSGEAKRDISYMSLPPPEESPSGGSAPDRTHWLQAVHATRVSGCSFLDPISQRLLINCMRDTGATLYWRRGVQVAMCDVPKGSMGPEDLALPGLAAPKAASESKHDQAEHSDAPTEGATGFGDEELSADEGEGSDGVGLQGMLAMAGLDRGSLAEVDGVAPGGEALTPAPPAESPPPAFSRPGMWKRQVPPPTQLPEQRGIVDRFGRYVPPATSRHSLQHKEGKEEGGSDEEGQQPEPVKKVAPGPFVSHYDAARAARAARAVREAEAAAAEAAASSAQRKRKGKRKHKKAGGSRRSASGSRGVIAYGGGEALHMVPGRGTSRTRLPRVKPSSSGTVAASASGLGMAGPKHVAPVVDVPVFTNLAKDSMWDEKHRAYERIHIPPAHPPSRKGASSARGSRSRGSNRPPRRTGSASARATSSGDLGSTWGRQQPQAERAYGRKVDESDLVWAEGGYYLAHADDPGAAAERDAMLASHAARTGGVPPPSRQSTASRGSRRRKAGEPRGAAQPLEAPSPAPMERAPADQPTAPTAATEGKDAPPGGHTPAHPGPTAAASPGAGEDSYGQDDWEDDAAQDGKAEAGADDAAESLQLQGPASQGPTQGTLTVRVERRGARPSPHDIWWSVTLPGMGTATCPRQKQPGAHHKLTVDVKAGALGSLPDALHLRVFDAGVGGGAGDQDMDELTDEVVDISALWGPQPAVMGLPGSQRSTAHRVDLDAAWMTKENQAGELLVTAVYEPQ